MTISPRDFDELMTRVEVMTRMMSSDDRTRSQMKDEYYSKLKNNDYMLLKKAIDHILATHTIRTFPLLGEFFSALEVMRRTMSVPREEINCPYCRDGAGRIIMKCTDELGKKMGYTTTVYCTCKDGEIAERNDRLQDSRNKRKKLKRRTE